MNTAFESIVNGSGEYRARSRVRRVLVCGLLVAAVVCCSPGSPGRDSVAAQRESGLRALVGTTFPATVTTVVDGDTVHIVLDEGSDVTVRLDGIDTPERGEPFSVEARNAARVMLFTQRVEVRGTDVDRYGRLVARLTVDGQDTSVELVLAGLACHYRRYSSDPRLAAAELEAREAGRGFWAAGAQRPSCAVDAQRAPAADQMDGPLHGNTSSRVFHAPWCPNYRCRNCAAVFQTREEAVAAGYRPAGDCLR